MPLTPALSHDDHTERQFGPQATAYLASSVHASGADLAEAARRFDGHAADHVLDIGCGAGHLSFAIAPHVASVVAYDLSPGMLDVVRQAARDRALANVETAQGRSEALPFADARFDAVVTRYSAHHWADLPAAAAEMRRVLKPSGRLIVIDVVSPGTPLLDTHLQAVELLRDASHVRDASVAEWRALLAGAGFAIGATSTWKLPLEFESWVTRMRTPADRWPVIRSLWAGAPAEVQAHFRVASDGSFEADVAMIEAVAADRVPARESMPRHPTQDAP